MARGQLLGLMACPECGFPDAEVRNDKSESPYRFCPDCTAQFFTRGNPVKVKNLMTKLRTVTAQPIAGGADAVTVAPSKTEDATATPAAPAEVPKKRSLAFDLGAL